MAVSRTRNVTGPPAVGTGTHWLPTEYLMPCAPLQVGAQFTDVRSTDQSKRQAYRVTALFAHQNYSMLVLGQTVRSNVHRLAVGSHGGCSCGWRQIEKPNVGCSCSARCITCSN